VREADYDRRAKVLQQLDSARQQLAEAAAQGGEPQRQSVLLANQSPVTL
jgi:hypothetical protein